MIEVPCHDSSTDHEIAHKEEDETVEGVVSLFVESLELLEHLEAGENSCNSAENSNSSVNQHIPPPLESYVPDRANLHDDHSAPRDVKHDAVNLVNYVDGAQNRI